MKALRIHKMLGGYLNLRDATSFAGFQGIS